MKFYYLLLGALCVWRITHLLHAEDGPRDMLFHLRKKMGEGFWGELLDCFYCLSVWVAAPFAVYIGETPGEKALLWPALSAAAILLERLTNHHFDAPPAPYFEDKEKEDDMLWEEEATTPGRRPGSPDQ